MDWIKRKRRKAILSQKEETSEQDDGLETPEEYKQRWRSVYVIYFTMFLMSLGFSVVLTGIWPFLDKLDPSAGKEFMGYVVAANPLGQILFSPLVGWWSNRAKTIRLPLLSTIALFIVSSGIYAFLEVFKSEKKYWMLIGRFFVGVSSANIAAARSYLSAATRLSERTTAVSIVSLAQVLGFVIGPGLQAAVTPLGEDGVQISGALRLNMFTATGWINVILGIVNFILFLPVVFNEHKIAAREAMMYQGKTNEKDTWQSVTPDYLTAWSLIFAFFILVFNFVLVETLATSLTMDQFAWSKKRSLYNMGIIMSIGALIAIAVFSLTGKLTRKFQERKLLLWGGFLITMLGSVFLIPWGPDPPVLALPENMTLAVIKEMSTSLNFTNYTMGEMMIHLADDEELLGCPVASQPWCEYTPAMTVTQFFLAYVCASIGYPLGVTMIQTIFSKILGPRPQGVWMGLLTGSGCLSRVMGPVFVSFVYTKLGPIWTFTITTVIMILSMGWIKVINEKLIPPDLCEKTAVSDTEMQEMRKLSPKDNGIDNPS